MIKSILKFIENGMIRLVLLLCFVLINLYLPINGVLACLFALFIGLVLLCLEIYIQIKKITPLKFFVSIPSYILYGFSSYISVILYFSLRSDFSILILIALVFNIMAMILYLNYDFQKRKLKFHLK